MFVEETTVFHDHLEDDLFQQLVGGLLIGLDCHLRLDFEGHDCLIFLHGCRSCPNREAVETAIQNKALVAIATAAERDTNSGDSGDENDGSPYHGYVIRRADECNDDEDYPDFDNAGEGKFEVLLDILATNHLIQDRELLHDIRGLDSPVRFNGISGGILVTKCGTIP
jgi:hypothetical protein